jgi:tRNA G18 (ribose-2'-O)-methylase SpoU
MSELIFDIRLCASCGLRYPIRRGDSFGERCPVCMGETVVVSSKVVKEEERMIERPSQKDKAHRAVLLDNIRSAWNVGSILRSADGFGFNHVYLCGITPTPDNEAVMKTSLGAEDAVPWSYHKDAVKLVMGLKKEGWKVSALEEGGREIGRAKVDAAGKSILILGSEVTGVDPDLLSLSDEILSIPMRGQKRSLNVAIAFSVAAFALGEG